MSYLLVGLTLKNIQKFSQIFQPPILLDLPANRQGRVLDTKTDDILSHDNSDIFLKKLLIFYIDFRAFFWDNILIGENLSRQTKI